MVYSDECDCPCHTPGIAMMHCFPCCQDRPADEPPLSLDWDDGFVAGQQDAYARAPSQLKAFLLGGLVMWIIVWVWG